MDPHAAAAIPPVSVTRPSGKSSPGHYWYLFISCCSYMYMMYSFNLFYFFLTHQTVYIPTWMQAFFPYDIDGTTAVAQQPTLSTVDKSVDGSVTESRWNTAVGNVWDMASIRAILFNTCLWSVFCLVHSSMARSWFKQHITLRMVPEPMERTLFVVISSFLLTEVVTNWQALPTVLYQLPSPLAGIADAVAFVGYCFLFAATFMLDHAALYGMKQAYLAEQYHPMKFSIAGMYAYIRHPIMTGMLIVFWSVPVMTVGHLLLSALGTLYIIIAVFGFEEADLQRDLPEYAEYRTQTAAFVPLQCPFKRYAPATGVSKKVQ